MVPAIVPAKSPGKLTAQFKTHDLNLSSKCIPVRLCTGIYHKDNNQRTQKFKNQKKGNVAQVEGSSSRGTVQVVQAVKKQQP